MPTVWHFWIIPPSTFQDAKYFTNWDPERFNTYTEICLTLLYNHRHCSHNNTRWTWLHLCCGNFLLHVLLLFREVRATGDRASCNFTSLKQMDFPELQQAQRKYKLIFYCNKINERSGKSLRRGPSGNSLTEWFVERTCHSLVLNSGSNPRDASPVAAALLPIAAEDGNVALISQRMLSEP